MNHLSSTLAVPNPLDRLLGKLKRLPGRIRNRLGAGPEPHEFAIRDLATLNPFLAARNWKLLTSDRHEAEIDMAGAMRYVLGTLASSSRLRRRFPNALSAGINGPFARSLLLDRRLTAGAKANIRTAFDYESFARLRRVFEFREDLRGVYPLGLTPKGRGEFLEWLLTFGVADFKHVPEAALWFHFELDEDPSRGLVASYRLHPEWQAAVPHGLTRFGWDELKDWIGERYGFDAKWLKRASLPPQFGPWDELQLVLRKDAELRRDCPVETGRIAEWARSNPALARSADAPWFEGLAKDIRDGLSERPAVNVIGLFRYTSGLQQAVKSTVESLERNGVRTGLRDFPVLFLREPRNRENFDAIELHDVTIINTGIDLSVDEAYRKSGLHPRPGAYGVGIWWWEMEDLPAKWHDRCDGVDEVWAPTRFIADAMRKVFAKPVLTMNPGIELPPFEPLGKAHFGLDPSKYSFGFVFDMNSRMQRKNPLGLIEAFRRAFRPDEPVELVIKVSPPESFYKDQWQLLRAAIDATPNVKLVDRVLSRPELLALIEAADCGVSLHRSEGFGLTCAEAMLMGKPVIATGYSGNLDFMTAENSYLVRYGKVKLEEDIDPYPKGAVWAEPSVDHAAELMREVYENRDAAARKGLRAKADMLANFSLAAAGKRMRTRLDEIARLRGR